MRKSGKPASSGDRHDQSRKVHLAHQVAGVGDAARAMRQRDREEVPGKQRGEVPGRVGLAIGRDVGHASEHHGEENGRDQRNQHRPRNAEQRLAVAHLYIAPGQEVEQLTVRPEFAELETDPAAGRLNSENFGPFAHCARNRTRCVETDLPARSRAM
jgi:hypothetical protein